MLLRLLGHGGLGEQQHACDRYRVLEPHTNDFRRIDDPGFVEINVLLACRIEALVRGAREHLIDDDAAIRGRVLGDLAGQVFTMFVLTVAAAEAAIGLAILVIFFRNKGSIAVEDISTLKG